MLLTSLGLVWAKKEYRAFFLTMIMSSLGFSSGLPLISLYLVRDVGVGLTVAGLFSMSQALSGLITGILIGRWSDRWNSRLLAIRLAVLWNALGWIVFALSPWHWLTLSVGGIFLGVNSVVMGLGVTYGQQLSPDRPGEVSGIIFGGTSVSAVLGNLVGGVTVPALGIPHVFLIPTGFFAVSCMMFLGIERMSRRKAVAAIVVDERRAAG